MVITIILQVLSRPLNAVAKTRFLANTASTNPKCPIRSALINSGAMGRQKESMKNSKLDWKGVGQFLAVLVQVWTIIKLVVVREKVRLEILDWMVGDGEQDFRNLVYGLTDKYNEYLLRQKQLSERDIDFDSTPVCPPGLTIAPDSDQITSRVRGKRKLSDIRTRLHLDAGQTNVTWVKGYDLKTRLEGQEVYGVQLLEYYLKHLDRIPEDWKRKGSIFFWGTIFCDDKGDLYVRCLEWRGMNWVLNYRWLGYNWGVNDPAAISEESSESKP